MNDITLVLKSDWFALYAATGTASALLAQLAREGVARSLALRPQERARSRAQEVCPHGRIRYPYCVLPVLLLILITKPSIMNKHQNCEN